MQREVAVAASLESLLPGTSKSSELGQPHPDWVYQSDSDGNDNEEEEADRRSMPQTSIDHHMERMS